MKLTFDVRIDYCIRVSGRLKEKSPCYDSTVEIIFPLNYSSGVCKDQIDKAVSLFKRTYPTADGLSYLVFGRVNEEVPF